MDIKNKTKTKKEKGFWFGSLNMIIFSWWFQDNMFPAFVEMSIFSWFWPFLHHFDRRITLQSFNSKICTRTILCFYSSNLISKSYELFCRVIVGTYKVQGWNERAILYVFKRNLLFHQNICKFGRKNEIYRPVIVSIAGAPPFWILWGIRSTLG